MDDDNDAHGVVLPSVSFFLQSYPLRCCATERLYIAYFKDINFILFTPFLLSLFLSLSLPKIPVYNLPLFDFVRVCVWVLRVCTSRYLRWSHE